MKDKKKSGHKSFIISKLFGNWKLIVVIISLYLPFAQYVDDSIQSRIDRAETRFSSAVSQLESSTLPVKASGLRTIF